MFHLHHLEHATAAETAFLVTSTGLAAWAGPGLIVIAVLQWRRERSARVLPMEA